LALSTEQARVLIDAARDAQRHAYAPYSNFHVGAAVLTGSGDFYTGCNVENASYGATLCAERVAIAKMVSSGVRDLRAVAVFTTADEPAMPCGICRQTLLEFGADIDVVVSNGVTTEATTLLDLLPRPFRLDR
jgi:cytidine deaminase